MYVDGGYKFEVSEAEVEALSDVCQHCKGLCCTYFRMSLLYNKVGENVVVDWEACKARNLTEEARLNMDFACTHFSAVPGCRADYGWVTLTCSALNPETHLCDAYTCRPPLCRGYICQSAWYTGMPPSPTRHPMQAQSATGPFPGFDPGNWVSQLWLDTVGKRIKKKLDDMELIPVIANEELINENVIVELPLEQPPDSSVCGIS